MSYLGQVELKSSEIRRVNVTGSTSATHTLTWTPASEQSLIITINGIKQQNNYSISGTTLTLDTALVATDEMEVIGILDIGEAVTPPDDSISTAKIQDDAVTADKLANSINTEIAANTAKTGITSGQASAITANTAKVTNATHTGDVTGATALTIASGAVDLAMLSATGTADSTTFLRGDNAWAEAGGDNTPAFAATLSATQTVSSSGTWTKVEFDSEIFDSDSCYDSSTNYRFTPTTAGKYFVYGQAAVHYMTSTMLKVAILKNGSIYVYTSVSASNSDENYGYTGAIINFNGSTDYVEFYILQGQSGITPGIPTGMAQFGAFKVII